MGGRAARRKGHDFERRVANDFKKIYPEAKRGLQSRNEVDNVPDVETPYFYIECKAYKKAPLRAALDQAVEHANKEAKGRYPLAICKDDRKPPIALMLYTDLLLLVKRLERLTRAVCGEQNGKEGKQNMV